VHRSISITAGLIALLLGWPTFASTQIAREGDVVSTKPRIATPAFESAGTEQKNRLGTVSRPGSDFLRLHFTNIRDRSTHNYSVVIYNAAAQPVLVYKGSELGARQDFWSEIISGGAASIYVEAHTPPRGLYFEVPEYAVQRPSAITLSVVHNEFQPIASYSGDPVISVAQKSVAKLALIIDDYPASCTGFLVADGLLLTNQHCIASQAQCNDSVAIFGYQTNSSGHLQAGEQFRCQKLLASDPDLGYALIRLTSHPGGLDKWGTLKISQGTIGRQAPIMIIQHPGGNPKEISKKDCMSEDIGIEGMSASLTDFSDSCDTASGSSGSPVLNDNGWVVGLHHLGFSSPPWDHSNRAVEIALVVQDLKQKGVIDLTR
jgi:V8-like Glu-specific endopeptidase